MTATKETKRGVVERLFICLPDKPFAAGVMQVSGEGGVRFRGRVVARVGDSIEVVGEWKEDPKYGRQFDVESGSAKLDDSPDALARVLSSDDRFSGIGKVRALALARAAGKVASSDGSIGAALCENPEAIARAANVSVDIVLNAAKVWRENERYFETIAELCAQGWTNGQAQALYDKFREAAPAIAREDPYALIRKVRRFGFKTVDAVARSMGVSSSDPARIAAGIGFCLDNIANDGHTWTTRAALASSAMDELRPDTLDGEVLIGSTIESMIESGFIVQDQLPGAGEVVADMRAFMVEWEVFDRLSRGFVDEGGASKPVSLGGEETIEVAKTLNDGQRAALVGFAGRRYSIISGGAGVGKTYTMNAICTAAEESGLRVELCAPTGKASRKLAKSTSRKAQTIHRLLSPAFRDGEFVFTKHRGDPIEADLIIVDEVSMVDVRLMAKLLDAVAPETRLLLVGDHNQIPSVSAGAILRDVLENKARYPGAIHVLDQVVRQAGVLARNTTAVLGGVVSAKEESCWKFLRTERGHEVASAAACADLVERVVTSPEPVPPFISPLDFSWDVQVLAPMRKGPLGTYSLNAHLQALRQRLLGHAAPEPAKPNSPPRPLVGDRVLWNKNDYELGLLNGTQAVVTSFGKGGSICIFTEEGREVEVPPTKKDRIELAYAMTIHKSQGSEWPLVVLVVSASHAVMADRNLLYTGISRASEAIVIMGDAEGLSWFANKRRSTTRQTFGKHLLAGWIPARSKAVNGLELVDFDV